jgi:large subunit ribosomal protein L9
MQNKLLLLEDVINLGRSGDIVTVKPGFARNFLVPQKKAVVANKFALRLQARLVEERQKKAEADRKESEAVAAQMAEVQLSTEVKVDAEGHLYGSVAVVDVMKILERAEVIVEKNQIILPHPIKTLGEHEIQLKLKEGVVATLRLTVKSDKPLAEEVAPVSEEAPVEEV